MRNPVCGSKDLDLYRYQKVLAAFDIRSQIGNYCMCINREPYLQIYGPKINVLHTHQPDNFKRI
jgi:hypothetical protein